MPRGLWSQSVVVLMREAPKLAAIVEALAPRGPRVREGGGAGSWIGAGQSVLVPHRPEANGVIELDVQARPWPDSMGDPQTDADLFGAWTMGAFGPAAFPDNLARAVQQCVCCPEAAAAAAQAHGAFVRARVAYVYGAGEDAKVLPEDHDPLAELEELAAIGAELFALDGALAFFAPGGEVILDRACLDDSLAHARQADVPPLDAFTHVRLFDVGDVAGWSVMDTVGMDQLFLPDSEACVPPGADVNTVANWLRNVCLYLLNAGAVIEPGHTVDGPGGAWRAMDGADGLVAPPRPCLRWAPEGVALPDVFTSAG